MHYGNLKKKKCKFSSVQNGIGLEIRDNGINTFKECGINNINDTKDYTAWG